MKKNKFRNVELWTFSSVGVVFCITGAFSGENAVIVGGALMCTVALVISNQKEILNKQDLILERKNRTKED